MHCLGIWAVVNTLLCLIHRYDQLSPSMVERGEWGMGEDRRLLLALREGEWQEAWEVGGAGADTRLACIPDGGPGRGGGLR